MTKQLLAGLACLSALIVTVTGRAEVPDVWLNPPMAEAFGAPPTIIDPILAPDGTQLLFLQQNPLGVSMLRSINLADGSINTLLSGQEGGYDIIWCEFAKVTRILCELRQGIPGRSVDYLRYFSFNSDGSDLQEMQRGSVCTPGHPWRDAPKIDWLPDDPENVLFICGGRALMLNVFTRRVTAISGAGEIGRAGELRAGPVSDSRGGPDNPRGSGLEVGSNRLSASGNLANISGAGSNIGAAQQLFTDGRGVPNIYGAREENTDRWMIRDDVDSPWREFHRVDPIRFEEPFRPVGYGSSTDRIFNISWDADAGAWALFLKNLDGDYSNRLIFSHGATDVERVDTMGPYNRVVAAAFLDGRASRAIVDRRVAEVYEFVSGLLPSIDVEIVDESWDQNIYLLKAKAPGRAGEYLLVNMETEGLQAIGPEYDHLASYTLAETRTFRYEGSDGGMVTAHLTLPDNAEGPVPAVVIPRSRFLDEQIEDPHYLTQFLAASGYAVLRINQRVDAEYGGGGWLAERSVVGWNQSADDIRDGIRYLVDAGFAEPGRVCAAGKNYGAYVALMTAVKYPDSVACIVSIAGVTDPKLAEGAETVRIAFARGGDDLLDDASPVQRADEIAAPALLFHGENDPLINMADHTVTLERALERADKDVTFIEYPYGDHDLSRGPYRIDMLARIRGFLAENIGPPLAEDESVDQQFRWRPGD